MQCKLFTDIKHAECSWTDNFYNGCVCARVGGCSMRWRIGWLCFSLHSSSLLTSAIAPKIVQCFVIVKYSPLSLARCRDEPVYMKVSSC